MMRPIRRQQRRKRPHMRMILVACIAIVLIVALTIIWIVVSLDSWPSILSAIFVGVTLIVQILQWLLPLPPIYPSLESSLHPHLERNNAAMLDDTAIASVTSATWYLLAPPNATKMLETNVTQEHDAYKVKFNHIAAPPGVLFDRVDLIEEIRVCLSDGNIRGIFLWGGRGCGKSLIAKWIVEMCIRECMNKNEPLYKRFTHIVWLTFRKEELTTSRIRKPYNYHQSKHDIYAEILQVHEQPYLGNRDPLKGVQKVLRSSPTLVILDSFEFFLENNSNKLDNDIAALLSEVAPGSFFILTSWQNSDEIRRYGYRVIEVKAFDVTLAKEYFIYCCREKSISLPLEQWGEEIHRDIVKATQGIPLALELVGNYVHNGSDVKEALEYIISDEHDLWDYIYKKVLQQLQEDEWRLLLTIIIFKSPLDKQRLREVIYFDKHAITRFDVHLRLERAITYLKHKGLFTGNYDEFHLHDTLREYVLHYVLNNAEYMRLLVEVQKDFINWAFRIVAANDKWEVDSKQANAIAIDLNNLIQALELLLSQKTNEDTDTLCYVGTTIAHYLHISGRWSESERFLRTLLERTRNDVYMVKIQVLLGRHFAHLENFAAAESYLHPAMKKAEEIGDETLLAEVYLRMGQTYLRTQPEEAFTYLKNARDKATKNDKYDSLRAKISATSYMAEILLLKGRGEDALELLKESDEHLLQLQWDRARAHHTRLKADAYLNLGDKAMALAYYNESSNLSENAADGRLLAWNYLGLAELTQSLDYARKAKDLFETVGLTSQNERVQELINKLTAN